MNVFFFSNRTQISRKKLYNSEQSHWNPGGTSQESALQLVVGTCRSRPLLLNLWGLSYICNIQQLSRRGMNSKNILSVCGLLNTTKIRYTKFKQSMESIFRADICGCNRYCTFYVKVRKIHNRKVSDELKSDGLSPSVLHRAFLSLLLLFLRFPLKAWFWLWHVDARTKMEMCNV